MPEWCATKISKAVIEHIKNLLLPELRELRSKVESIDTKFDAKFEALKSEFQGLKSEFQGLSHKVDGISCKVDGISYKVDGLIAQNDAIKFLLDYMRQFLPEQPKNKIYPERQILA